MLLLELYPNVIILPALSVIFESFKVLSYENDISSPAPSITFSILKSCDVFVFKFNVILFPKVSFNSFKCHLIPVELVLF